LEDPLDKYQEKSVRIIFCIDKIKNFIEAKSQCEWLEEFILVEMLIIQIKLVIIDKKQDPFVVEEMP
jgi:hypothetical protein